MANTTDQRPFWLTSNGQRLIEELPVRQNHVVPFTKVLVSGVQGDTFQLRISKDAYPHGVHVYSRGRAKHTWECFYEAFPDYAYQHRHLNPSVTQHAHPYWECWFNRWVFGKTRLVWCVVVPLTEEGRYDGLGQQVAFNIKCQPRHWQVANADRYIIERLNSLSLAPTASEKENAASSTAEPSAGPPPSAPAPRVDIPRQASVPCVPPVAVFDPLAAARLASESRRFDNLRQPVRQSAPLRPFVHRASSQHLEAPRPNRDWRVIEAVGPKQEPVGSTLPSPALTLNQTQPPTREASQGPTQSPAPAEPQAPTQSLKRTQPEAFPLDAVESDDSDDDTSLSQYVQLFQASNVPATGVLPPNAIPPPRRSQRIQELQRAFGSAGHEIVRVTPCPPVDRSEKAEILKCFWQLPMTANPDLRFMLTVEPWSAETLTQDREPQAVQLEEDSEDEGEDPANTIPVEELPEWIRQIVGDRAMPVARHIFSDHTPFVPQPVESRVSSPNTRTRARPTRIPSQKYNRIGFLDQDLHQRFTALQQHIAMREAAETKAYKNRGKRRSSSR